MRVVPLFRLSNDLCQRLARGEAQIIDVNGKPTVVDHAAQAVYDLEAVSGKERWNDDGKVQRPGQRDWNDAPEGTAEAISKTGPVTLRDIRPAPLP